MLTAKKVMIWGAVSYFAFVVVTSVAAALYVSFFPGDSLDKPSTVLPVLFVHVTLVLITFGAVSYSALRRYGGRYWMSVTFLLVLGGLIPIFGVLNTRNSWDFIPYVIAFLFVSLPILLGWLAGAAYQLGRSRYLRERRDN